MFARGAGENSAPEPTANSSQLRYLGPGNLSYKIYSPFCYLPAAVGIRIVRILDLSPLSMLYAARLMNVLSFSAALAIALLLVTNFRGLYTAVGLLPMTLHQAAAVSADPVMIALSMVGFALVLRAREQPVSRRYLGVLLATLPVWVLCKNSVWAVPVLLLIPTERFGTKRKRVAYLLAATLLALAAVLLWRHLTRDAFEDYRIAELSRGIDVYANVATVTNHPLTVLHDVMTRPNFGSLDRLLNRLPGASAAVVLAPPLHAVNYIRQRLFQFVGVFGWNFLGPPLRFVYLATLLAIACFEANPVPFTREDRIVLTCVFLAALAETYFAILVLDGPHRNGRYVFWSSGFAGRYMLPYCLAGLLTLKQNWRVLTSQIAAATALGVAVVFGLLSVGTVVRYYYW